MTHYILPVLVCMVFAQALGMLWYSKFLFGTVWRKASGITPEQMEKGKKNMVPFMVIAALGAAIGAIVLLFTIRWFGEFSILGGAHVGILVWFGYVMVTQLDSVLWDGKSFRYFFINTAYSLVKFAGMGMILGAWLG
ncbi:MAG TPA: DUF1761 domain-containing protein [Candidatus Magasanikbacteria bacterium]|nr:DUF1761 domain-containing protein [Candidatus Magasanikbacteria bacterium]